MRSGREPVPGLDAAGPAWEAGCRGGRELPDSYGTIAMRATRTRPNRRVERSGAVRSAATAGEDQGHDAEETRVPGLATGSGVPAVRMTTWR